MKETWTRRVKVALTGLAFVALFGVALQGLISTPPGLAGGTATVNVTAEVKGTCKFTTASATLDFGDLDPSSPTDVDAGPVTLKFWCTYPTDYTIGDNNGKNASGTTHRLINTSVTPNDYIPYNYCYDLTSISSCSSDTSSVTGQGKGPQNLITLYIAGTILGSNYANASAGSYSDTVTMTISP
jgi:spore coat protein U-like protein